MGKFLMAGDRQLLYYDLNDAYVEVINNRYLPLSLRDYIKTTVYDDKETAQRSAEHLSALKDYLSGRVLTLSRDNAKQILGAIGMPKSDRTSERIAIVHACNGLSMTDNIWVKDENDNRSYVDIDLRTHPLSEVSYEISMIGKNISVQKEILLPDIATTGMFRKTWHRTEDNIELWKSDRTNGNINVLMEKKASDILDASNVEHVRYHMIERDGLKISVCSCLATDDLSLIDGYELQDFARHHGTTLLAIMEQVFPKETSRMCIADYVLANTDRHLGNIQFFVSNETGKVEGLTPLMDFNQALIADELGTDISDLNYELTGKTMQETAMERFVASGFRINEDVLPEKCKDRLTELQRVAERKTPEKPKPTRSEDAPER